jgi:hypothetical protein
MGPDTFEKWLEMMEVEHGFVPNEDERNWAQDAWNAGETAGKASIISRAVRESLDSVDKILKKTP